MKKVNLKEYAVLSQSPYTGFNRRIARKLLRVRARINPPIRGSIGVIVIIYGISKFIERVSIPLYGVQ